jgi:hypothetical protein
MATSPIPVLDFFMLSEFEDNIFLYNGASPGVQNTLKMVIRSERDGVYITTTSFIISDHDSNPSISSILCFNQTVGRFSSRIFSQ